MATPKVGDKARFYGRVFTITAVGPGHDGATPVAVCEEVEGLALRENAKREVAALRERQASVDHMEEGPERQKQHNAIKKQIQAFDKELRQAYFKVKLRLDLLRWWEEEHLWVQDGKILSDDELAQATELLGRKPAPLMQRTALSLLKEERRKKKEG